MFPEITHDDIFRLETERLWLRWPHASDVDGITRYCDDPEVALRTAEIPYPYARPHAEGFVDFARTANSEGAALHLMLTLKRQPGEPLGSISMTGADNRGCGSLGFALARSAWNQGLMTEAARAFVDLVFNITGVDHIVSSALPDNRASLRVQEKIGFVETGEKMLDAPARGGPLRVTTTLLKRGAARTLFGARRPRLSST
jgi:RimJ/RimL family protein N-acetyltransferase